MKRFEPTEKQYCNTFAREQTKPNSKINSMKTNITLILFLLVTLVSFNANATVYTYTSDALGWTLPNGNPGGTIGLTDTVYVLSGTWFVPIGTTPPWSTLTNYGYIRVYSGASINADFVSNFGTIILDGTIVVTFSVTNFGAINGTGAITSAFGSFIPNWPVVTNAGGTINGSTGSVVGGGGTGNLGNIPNDPGYVLYDATTPYPIVTCSNKLQVKANLTLTADMTVGELIIDAGFIVTIPSNMSLTICDSTGTSNGYDGGITNYGLIQINDNSALVQLMEGNTNSGNGFYSVVQTGHPDSLKYNIWAAPINAAPIGGDGIAGGGVFSGSNPCDIFMYDSPTSSWMHDYASTTTGVCNGNNVTFSGSNGDGFMDIGRGYFITGDGSATSRNFIGYANNGNVNASTVALSTSDFALVGNPYPSGLSAERFLIHNTGLVNSTVWFWADDGSAGAGYDPAADYATWTLAGGVGTGATGGGVTTIPDGKIGVAQGFWVEPTSTGTIQFTNAMRSDTNVQFFKTDNNISRIWMSLETPSGIPNNILVATIDDATDGFDSKYDGKKFSGNAHVKFVSVIGNDEFAIQAIPTLSSNETKVVPLSLFTDETGIHTLGEVDRENISSDMQIFIRDLELGILHNVEDGLYSVQLNGNQEYKNRFELVFSMGDVSTNINENEISNFKLINANGIITLTNNEGISGDVTVVDITGKVVWNKQNVGNTNSIAIDIDGVSSGVYFINVITNNERVYSNKLIQL